MVSLVDIVPQTRTVTLAAGELEVRGLGLRHLASLFMQFPALRDLFVEDGPEVSTAELLLQAPEAAAVIVAEAANQPDAAEAIASGTAMSADELLATLAVIRDLTFPRGIGPFLEGLAALMAGFAAALTGRVAVTHAPPVPNGSLPPGTMPPPS